MGLLEYNTDDTIDALLEPVSERWKHIRICDLDDDFSRYSPWISQSDSEDISFELDVCFGLTQQFVDILSSYNFFVLSDFYMDKMHHFERQYCETALSYVRKELLNSAAVDDFDEKKAKEDILDYKTLQLYLLLKKGNEEDLDFAHYKVLPVIYDLVKKRTIYDSLLDVASKQKDVGLMFTVLGGELEKESEIINHLSRLSYDRLLRFYKDFFVYRPLKNKKDSPLKLIFSENTFGYVRERLISSTYSDFQHDCLRKLALEYGDFDLIKRIKTEINTNALMTTRRQS